MFARTVTTTTRRLLIVLAALGLAAAAVWTPAQAGAQQAPPTPVVPPTFTLPAGLACSFPVQVDQHGKTATLHLPNGTVIVTSPALKVTLTNVETGKQVNLNIPG